MKTFTEFLNEGRASVGGEDQYKNSHGKKPTGQGLWVFSKARSMDLDRHTENKDWVKIRGDYRDAKKEAIKWAGKMGHSIIFVQS